MIESFIGLIIAAMAISSLMLSIESIEKSFRNAGRHSLTKSELEILNSAGINTEQNINILKNDIQNIPQNY
tara:strand:+ start:3993 stop:4205 length:213 start_codon:yes stop_codon:yes gene_type:complete